MLAQLKDCIGGLLHLGPNVITFRTLLHLGQLLHLGLQQWAPWCESANTVAERVLDIFEMPKIYAAGLLNPKMLHVEN